MLTNTTLTPEALRDWRLAHHWSQPEAGRRLGYSDSSISALETGRQRIQPAVAEYVAANPSPVDVGGRLVARPELDAAILAALAGEPLSAGVLCMRLGLGWSEYAYLRGRLKALARDGRVWRETAPGCWPVWWVVGDGAPVAPDLSIG